MILYKCDRCGHVDRLRTAFNEIKVIDFCQGNTEKELLFCNSCTSDFNTWVSQTKITAPSLSSTEYGVPKELL